METESRRPILTTGLGVPFTSRSVDFLSQWSFGDGGGYLTLLAARAQGDLQLAYAVYGGLRPGMTFDRLARFAFMWLADPELQLALRSHLVDLSPNGGATVLPYLDPSTDRSTWTVRRL